MKRLLLSTASLGALLVAPPASAADLPLKAAAPIEAAYRWTGFYIGGTISAVSSAMSTGPFSYQTVAGNGDAYDFGHGDASQVGFGGVLGYNYQIGRTVVGVEG